MPAIKTRPLTVPRLIKHFLALLEKTTTADSHLAFISASDRDAVRVCMTELSELHAGGLKKEVDLNAEVKIAGTLWSLLMKNALQAISQTKSLRGLGMLNKFYKDHVEFENILFGLDPDYRDHVMHSLWAYLLGVYIMHRSPYSESSRFRWGISVTGHPTDKEKQTRRRLESEMNHFRGAAYCISALCHDLAYPFEQIGKINKKWDDMKDNIGIPAFEHLQYDFSPAQLPLLQELLTVISQNAYLIEDTYHLWTCNPIYVDMAHSLEHRKHGIMSAYLLYRISDTMRELEHYGVEHLDKDYTMLKEFLVRSTILHTMASHTCFAAYSSCYWSFRFLLSLVDELEEFSRCKRNGRRNEVQNICKTYYSYETPGEFLLQYVLKPEGADDISHKRQLEAFFYKRALRFCQMIAVEPNPEEDDNIRKFTVICHVKDFSCSLVIGEGDATAERSWDAGRIIPLHPDPENALGKEFKPDEKG